MAGTPGYVELIRSLQPAHDPRHIEAYMRLEHPTLDGLSRSEFGHEAYLAACCVDADPEAAEELAQSYAL
jgi:hypothetical protein